MHTLVDELPAAPALGLRPPFIRITRPPAVSVARTQVHERPQRTGIDEPPRLPEGAMKAVIETDTYAHAVLRSELLETSELIRVSRRGLLDEHVLAGGDGRTHDLRLHIRRGGDDDRGDVAAAEWLAPVRTAGTAMTQRGELRGALAIEVYAVNQAGRGQVARTLAAHHTAADECDIHWLLPKSSCRSCGTMRRRV
jgi:hypothetical protein